MKISTRIGTAFAILIAAIVAGLSYQVSRIDKMQAINHDLAGINFRAAITSLQMLRAIDQEEEFTRKYFATEGDPVYGSALEVTEAEFSQELRELKSLRLSAAEQEAIGALEPLWRQFLDMSGRQRPALRSRQPRAWDEAEASRVTLLKQLRSQIEGLNETARRTIQAQAEESAQTGQRAARISLYVAIACFALSLLVSFWIVRAIWKPLRRLTEGTRAVAEGKFFYRLAAHGNDQFAHSPPISTP